MQIQCIIGLNYGDEGKGVATNYFCSKTKTPVLNIRYNGGSQAGHRVCLKDGREHVFSTFGAGTFNDNVDTYLSKFFIFNPLLFLRELNVVRGKGIKSKIFVDKRAIVTTPYDMFINQLENEDGGCRTTGCGIYKTVLRSKRQPILADFLTLNHTKALLEETKNYYLTQYENDADYNRLSKEQLMKFFRFLNNKTVVENFCIDVEKTVERCIFVDSDNIHKMINDTYENLVFEGAQGCLLSEEKDEVYNTPSKCGFDNIKDILDEHKIICYNGNLEVNFITRSYLTRHGAGEFKHTFVDNNFGGEEKTNLTNEFQGVFKKGNIDFSVFKNTIEEESNKIKGYTDKINIFVTHLDKTVNKIMFNKMVTNVSDMLPKFPIVKKIYGCYSKYGEVKEYV